MMKSLEKTELSAAIVPTTDGKAADEDDVKEGKAEAPEIINTSDAKEGITNPTKAKGSLCEPSATTNTMSNTEKVQTQEVKLKLIVRSKYWGKNIAGRVVREVNNDHLFRGQSVVVPSADHLHLTPNLAHGSTPTPTYRVLSSQAFVSKNGPYWGCCPHQGSRVLEITEHHFMEHHAGSWDLYHTSTIAVNATGHIVEEFFLLPQNQGAINVERKVALDAWNYMGTIDATLARMDLEPLIGPFLNEAGNKSDGNPAVTHHAHVQIMMNNATDREMTRKSKKGSSPSSGGKEGTSSAAFVKGSNKGNSNAPPLERTDSNSTETTSSHATGGGSRSAQVYPAQAYHPIHRGPYTNTWNGHAQRADGLVPSAQQYQYMHPSQVYAPVTNVGYAHWYPATAIDPNMVVSDVPWAVNGVPHHGGYWEADPYHWIRMQNHQPYNNDQHKHWSG